MQYDATPGEVLVENASAWQGRLSLRVYPILLAVLIITSVHERDSLARYTRTIVSENTMREVEASLVLHFGL